MSNSWKIYKLGNIADIKRGLASQHLDYVENESEGVRLIRINDFKSDSPKYIKETEETKKLVLKKGDVLIAGTGATAGISFLVDDLWDGLPYSYNAPRIRVKQGNDSAFLYFILNTKEIKRQQEKLFTGNAQPFLDTRAIASFKIPLPPLPEQQKIADILSTVDDKIDVIDQQITETQALKKGLMQRLLTKGIGHTRFKDSPLGEIPESWEVVKIEDIAKVTAGGTPSTKESTYWGGDIPWMNSGEINLRRIKSVEGRITEIGLKNSSTKIIPSNSVLMALAGQGKTRGKVAINEFPLCTNQSLAAIYSFKNAIYEFVFQNLESRYTEIRKMSTGDGGRGGLNLAIIKSITLAIPTIGEQEKIADILKSFDEKLEVLFDKKTHYQELKQGLMQQLLTGKIRVTELVNKTAMV
jgi:type I restriction enzyme S subunit